MPLDLNKSKGKFGTTPVFLASISTILGAILFLRFGYAVGNVGFIGAMGIILLGHLVTVPTALAIAEIATNRKVEGGGAYYIISRSFGLNIGATIGIALYLSEAISVSFYIIAFVESFYPFALFLVDTYSAIPQFVADIILDKKIVGIISMGFLTLLMLTKGANIGIKALYGIVAVLFASLLFFFVGSPVDDFRFAQVSFVDTIKNSEDFFLVFAIIFPAFTGMAAGLGLSGDLKNPKSSIPRGTIWATVIGIVVYILVAFKLVLSAPLQSLGADQLIMSKIAIWGPIIPIGLACASISSALGSVMVAPRTLQALGCDNIFPFEKLNNWMAKGRESDNEPINSSVITCILALVFVVIGDINTVAQLIAMFFMITYGAICTISFLEHFSGDPSYRPAFKSRWYISLIGAVLSVWLMFKMNTSFAIFSIIILTLFYYYISRNSGDKREIVSLFRDVLVQFAREIQIFIQKKGDDEQSPHWRPFVISINEESFTRKSAFDMCRWISFKYGFGTYIHYINGYLSKDTFKQSKEVLKQLLQDDKVANSNVYVDTIISPSYTSALAQVIQLSSISGKENNLILLTFEDSEKERFADILSNFKLLQATGFDVAIYKTDQERESKKEEIHVWISSRDYENSNMMILLSYIISSHPDWKNAKIKVFSIYPNQDEFENYKKQMFSFIESGRLPISPLNLKMIPQNEHSGIKSIINMYSEKADLTIIGFRNEVVKKQKTDAFQGYQKLGNILFVNSLKEKEIE
ncbi:MAG: amino acid permease [Flavobacteriales bacterium]|nr:amino acid permease [Flavobacteriales bacterium]